MHPSDYDTLLTHRSALTNALLTNPHAADLHLNLAYVYHRLRYPDLAAFCAYKALLLCDELVSGDDEEDEEEGEGGNVENDEERGEEGEGEGVGEDGEDEEQVGDSDGEDEGGYARLALRALNRRLTIFDEHKATTSTHTSHRPAFDLPPLEGAPRTPTARVRKWISQTLRPHSMLLLAHCLAETGCLRVAAEYLRHFNNAYDNLEGLSGECDNARGEFGWRVRAWFDEHPIESEHEDGSVDQESANDTGSAENRDQGQSHNVDDPAIRRLLPTAGRARREIYPWNTFEADRTSPAALGELNRMMKAVAPNCEVRVVELPVLSSSPHSRAGRTVEEEDESSVGEDSKGENDKKETRTVRQLGVFATTPIAPGEVVLREHSLLTAQRRVHDAEEEEGGLCDGCTRRMPALTLLDGARGTACDGGDGKKRREERRTDRSYSDKNLTRDTTSHVSKKPQTPTACPTCYTLFCSPSCLALAQESYHKPPLCQPPSSSSDDEADYSPAAVQNEPANEASEALYTGLLTRALALARGRGVHPLEVGEVRWIWGNFGSAREGFQEEGGGEKEKREEERYLPWNFEYNVLRPIRHLEHLGIDPFSGAPLNDPSTPTTQSTFALTDLWIHNTILAKCRATASARLSNSTSRRALMSGIRPEAAAVFPLWCLANHSCDPNVRWDWEGGGEMVMTARAGDERARWRRAWDGEGVEQEDKEGVPGDSDEGTEEESAEDEDDDNEEQETRSRKAGGIAKDEEILSHYVDVGIEDVYERREWGLGPLGGRCMCERCLWESREI